MYYISPTNQINQRTVFNVDTYKAHKINIRHFSNTNNSSNMNLGAVGTWWVQTDPQKTDQNAISKTDRV